MKRLLALAAALMLLTGVLGAGAESGGPFVMAGFDDASSNHDWNNNLFFRQMEERTGVNFTFRQFIDAAEYASWKASLKKGADLPDVLFKAALTPQETLSLYEAGVLVDLRPLLPENAPNLWALLQENPAWLKAVTLPDGAIAALPMIDPVQNNNLIWINKTWLTILQLDPPATADAFADVLRAFRDKDPNRNAKKDETPMTFTGFWDLRFLQHAFGLVMNDWYQTADEDGTVHCDLTGEQNRAFLAWLHMLWEERLIDHYGFNSSDTTRKITDSNAAITYGVVMGPSAMQMLPAGAAADYTVMMPLAWEGQQVYRSLLGELNRGTFAVTKACRDTAAMLRWVDFLYTEEGCFLSRSGVEGKDYEHHSDGTWSYLYDAENVLNLVMTEDTIADGGATPGYVPVSYQMSFDDSDTRRLLESLDAMRAFTREAVPQVTFTDAEEARLNEIWPPISAYCETAMTRFVTGDVELNDENWTAFCQKTEELGLPEVTQIWQQAVNR